jgi:hypothetical protein
VRTAVADELAIGDVHIRNAGFLVLPDTQEPMSDWPPGERGVIGLPLVIALQFIDWRSDGKFQIRGPHGLANGKQNLCFDGFYLVTRAMFHEQESGGTDLDFVLDTGNQSNTQLWRRFGDEFAYLLKKHGMPSRERITTVGGSNVRETVRLPELLLQVGGLETRLRPASIYAKPTGDETHHGLLGPQTACVLTGNRGELGQTCLVVGPYLDLMAPTGRVGAARERSHAANQFFRTLWTDPDRVEIA